MCRRGVCRAGKVSKEHTVRLEWEQQGVAGRNRGVSGQEEDETKIRDSMLGETAEWPPQERRNKPSSRADVAVEVTLNGTSQKWVAAN